MAATFASVLAAAVTFASVLAAARHTPTVIVSFDGFRPDYVRPDVTPHMAQFRDAAAAPPYIRSTFPTKTFVNHFSLATGMYSETHGVLDNYMFDGRNETMHYTYELFHYDESIQPIWVSGGRPPHVARRPTPLAAAAACFSPFPTRAFDFVHLTHVGYRFR